MYINRWLGVILVSIRTRSEVCIRVNLLSLTTSTLNVERLVTLAVEKEKGDVAALSVGESNPAFARSKE